MDLVEDHHVRPHRLQGRGRKRAGVEACRVGEPGTGLGLDVSARSPQCMNRSSRCCHPAWGWVWYSVKRRMRWGDGCW